MVRSHDVPLVSPSHVALITSTDAARNHAFESEGPASAPTVLVEVEEVPTALPAPPLVPMIAADWRPPLPSPLPVLGRVLALVPTPTRASRRPTVRVSEQRSHDQLRALRRSSPPTEPPPARAMPCVA